MAILIHYGSLITPDDELFLEIVTLLMLLGVRSFDNYSYIRWIGGILCGFYSKIFFRNR